MNAILHLLLLLFLPVFVRSKPNSTSNNQYSDQNRNTSLKSYRESKVAPHKGHKKILVTGGAGFIGSHVAEYLLDRGDDVVIIDEMNDYYDVSLKEHNLDVLRRKYQQRMNEGSGDSIQRGLSIYRGDICDRKFLEGIFQTENIKWVCHMAARAGVRPSIEDPFTYINTNILGTSCIFELSRKYGVKNVVIASSSSVYGGSDLSVFSEDDKVDFPISPYAATKKACELLGFTYHHLYKLNITCLRFFTVYGPRGRPDMAPFKFIDQVSRGIPIEQFGDGKSSRDYTYISDIVDGVVRSLDRPYPYQIFNLGKGNGTTLKEFIKLVEKYVGKKANINYLPDQKGDVHYTCANVSKAHHFLGYKARTPFEDGLELTIKWYNKEMGTKSD